jgi:competence protein ComEC
MAFCFWLLEKQKVLLWLSLTCLLGFMLIRSVSFWESNQQHKLIVYTAPKHQAIDVIDGRSFSFIGDSDLLNDDFLRNFHLQPSRVLHRVGVASFLPADSKEFDINSRHIAIVDTSLKFLPQVQRPKLDLVILSKNPKLYISNLVQSFAADQIVIDGSVSAWKAQLWKRDCDSLHIPCYDVSESGAFVMEL